MAVYSLSTRQTAHGETIMRVVRERGLIDKAAEYGIACSGAEASLTNWANAGTSTHTAKGGQIDGRQLNDAERAETAKSLNSPYSDGTPPWGDNLDSCGLFAQRWIEGWCGGDVMAIMTPDISTGDFLNHLEWVDGWETMPPGDVIREVQGYYDDIYTDWLDTAQAFVAARPGGSVPPGPEPAPEIPKKALIVKRENGVVDWAWTDDLSFMLRIPSQNYYLNLQFAGTITVEYGTAESCDTGFIDWMKGQVAGAGGQIFEPAQ